MQRTGLFFCKFVMIMLLMAGAASAEQVEALLGVETDFETGQLIFVVASSGCTTKADFRVDLRDGELTVQRLRRDDCKRMPFRERISFSLEELGLSPHAVFRLGNPIAFNENILMM